MANPNVRTTGDITRERLNQWADKLALSDATPLLLVGVGHHRHSGELVICTLENEEVSVEVIRALLLKAAAEL